MIGLIFVGPKYDYHMHLVTFTKSVKPNNLAQHYNYQV